MGFTIENEALIADIADPGEYAGPRFDWTGFIRQVTLKEGMHTFCTEESLIHGKGTGGIGLCNEFGNDRPVGYDEAKPGAAFPKIGIGLLTKPDEGRYNFFHPYAVRPFPVHTSVTANSAVFVCEPLESNGYAMRLEKAVSLKGAELEIVYSLHNTGNKPIVTTEYVHNFVAIDREPVGPDYELRFAAGLVQESEWLRAADNMLSIGSDTVRWTKPVDATFYARWHGFGGETPFYWELLNRRAGAGMRERGDAAGIRVALWGEPHVLSPEVFVDIEVQAGESMRWSRTYSFFAL